MRAAGSDSGSALVELAICLPLLVLTMVGAADFARVFYMSIELNNAARAGAQWGAYTLARSGDPLIPSKAKGAINITDVTVVAAPPACRCADDAGNFSPLAGGTTCATDVATSCPSPKHRVVTVTVTAQKTFTPIANYAGIFSPVSLTRTATLRVSE